GAREDGHRLRIVTLQDGTGVAGDAGGFVPGVVGDERLKVAGKFLGGAGVFGDTGLVVADQFAGGGDDPFRAAVVDGQFVMREFALKRGGGVDEKAGGRATKAVDRLVVVAGDDEGGLWRDEGDQFA